MGTEGKNGKLGGCSVERAEDQTARSSVFKKNIPFSKKRRKPKREVVKDLQLNSYHMSIDDYRSLWQLTTAQIAYFSFERAISTDLPLERILDTVWSSSSRCLDANNAFAQARGLASVEEVLGKSFGELFPPNEMNFSIIKKWIESDFQLAFYESYLEAPAGNRQLLQTSVYSRINRNLINNIWVIIKNIGLEQEVLRAEAEAEAEAHFRALVERPGLILVRVEPGERVLYISPHVENLINYSSGDIIRNPSIIRRLLHPDDIRQHHQLVLARKDCCKETTEAEYRIRHKDGSFHWIYEKQTPKISSSGEVEYYDSIILDIQKRKQLEAQLVHAQRMETMGTFAKGVAHEFNNRLAAIIGQIGLTLTELGKESPCYSRLAAAEQAAMCCAEITKTLLSFGSNSEQALEPLNIKRLLEDTVQLLNHILPSSIETSLTTQQPLKPIMGNYTALQQVLVNLAVNARDVMPEGGSLRIQARNICLANGRTTSAFASAKGGDYVEVAVIDSGAGIPASNLPFIFDPFFSTKSHNSASGLGLSTAYSIIKSHQGSIRVTNVKGGGTAFIIILPVCLEAPTDNRKNETAAAPKGHETILIAEDDDMVLQMVKSALTLHGYQVITAADGLEAVKVFTANSGTIDLALIDRTMPKLSGREVLDRIYTVAPDMRIVLTSGYANSGNEDLTSRSRSRFISKPYRLSQLLSLIRELLDSD